MKKIEKIILDKYIELDTYKKLRYNPINKQYYYIIVKKNNDIIMNL